jgi:MFS transporter, DHA1 family, tetracycline resistance protein
MLGIGIIIPIIPALFYSKTNGIHFAGLTDADSIRWTYCLLIAAFPFMQFFGAPILGSLSDRFGRKKIILFSLIGTALGYSLFSFAMYTQSLTILFLSRLIPGFFGGSLSVLFSAISDISSPEDKPKNFGLVGMAFGLGFVFGPVIGGLLADKTICSWFSLSTPFIFTAILSLINFISVLLFFNETINEYVASKLSLAKGFRNVKKAFTSVNLRVLFTITFLNTLGFAFFTTFFSVFMFTKFDATERQVGLVFLWVGLWLIFTQGFLLRKVFYKYSPESIISKTMLLMGISIFCMIFPPMLIGVMFFNFTLAISQGLNSPNLLTLVSKQALPHEQGEILGINQSMQSLAQIIPPLIVAVFGKNLLTFPFIFGGSLIILAWGLFVGVYKRK